MGGASRHNFAGRGAARIAARLAAWVGRADGVLRAEPWAIDTASAPGLARRTRQSLLGYVAVAGTFYGAVMGTYGGGGEHWLQPVYSGLKVPLLLLVTFALSLPTFWVLNLLMGVGADFGRALRALLATQAGLTLVLAALAPFTAVWYVSVADYHVAIFFNAAMFALASISAQFLLRRHYRPLVEANPVHRKLMRGWIVIYAFVGIQMGWVLRPFVGNPDHPAQLFRQGSWGNAYVEVMDMVWHALRG